MKIIAVLLNWKRQQNIVQTINSIRSQDLPITICLWNNNKYDNTKYDVDIQINSTHNLYCWPRWLMGALLDANYIFSLDDDLTFGKSNTIIECVKIHEHYSKSRENIAIGAFGAIIKKNIHYSQLSEVTPNNIKKDKEVDIIKGRFLFTSQSLINKVSLENDKTCDDIKISSFADLCLIPKSLEGHFLDLPEGEVALQGRPIHFQERNAAIIKYFPDKI